MRQGKTYRVAGEVTATLGVGNVSVGQGKSQHPMGMDNSGYNLGQSDSTASVSKITLYSYDQGD